MKHKPVLNDNGEFSGSSITRAAQACYESEIKYSVALFTLVKKKKQTVFCPCPLLVVEENKMLLLLF